MNKKVCDDTKRQELLVKLRRKIQQKRSTTNGVTDTPIDPTTTLLQLGVSDVDLLKFAQRLPTDLKCIEQLQEKYLKQPQALKNAETTSDDEELPPPPP